MHNWAEFRSARIHAHMHTCSTTSGLGHKKTNIFRPPQNPKGSRARSQNRKCVHGISPEARKADGIGRNDTSRNNPPRERDTTPAGRSNLFPNSVSITLFARGYASREAGEDQAGGDGRPPCCAASSPCRQANSPEHKRKDSMRGQHSRRDPPPLATIPPTIPPPAVGVAWRHGAVDSLTHHADAVGSRAGDD